MTADIRFGGPTLEALQEVLAGDFGFEMPKEPEFQSLRRDHRKLVDLVKPRPLGDNRRSIKEVAYELNFSSEYYFSHFFRRSTGMSPTQFRTQAKA